MRNAPANECLGCAVVTVISTTTLGIVLIVGCQKLGRHTWDVALVFMLSPWPQQVRRCSRSTCLKVD
jgi:hypothetical protein